MAKAIDVKCKVTGFKHLTPTVFEIKFRTGEVPVSFEAGQFVSIIVPGAGPNGRDLRRAYSIASEPENLDLELCVKLVEGGPGTNYLFKLRPGDEFKGMFPYGDFVYKTASTRQACFISTGTGIAPFRSMIRSQGFKNHGPKASLLLLGVRGEEELLYPELDGTNGTKFISTVSQPTGDFKGFKGRVTDYLRELGPSFAWKDTDFYLCGNGAMITEVKTILNGHGVEKPAIFQEKYY